MFDNDNKLLDEDDNKLLDGDEDKLLDDNDNKLLDDDDNTPHWPTWAVGILISDEHELGEFGHMVAQRRMEHSSRLDIFLGLF
jgi:hypothetical protein